MEVEEVQQAASKYSRLNSDGSRLDSSKLGEPCKADMHGGGDMVGLGRQWQNSSRIIRVSRASGGKDRHSKVWTAKGARDRRVRLSVNTAIQFYDLQDRLGYDQPSKAVEWLINAAADSINELPSLNNANFPPSERACLDQAQQHQEQHQQQHQHQQQLGSVSMSSSNNSETSKGSGSGLSLSRTEIRVKARERARERTTAKDKENVNTEKSSSSSFTQLLTAGINNNNNNNLKENGMARVKNDDDLSSLQWSSSLMGLSSSPRPSNVMSLLPFSASHDIQHQHQQQQQQQQLPFFPDNSLNFSIPSSTTTSAGFNRGTLQSNSSSSPSFLSYLQRFSSSDSGSSVPFFLGGAPVVDHQHQHYHHEHQPHPFNPAGLHLSYGNGSRHSEDKGKGKN